MPRFRGKRKRVSGSIRRRTKLRYVRPKRQRRSRKSSRGRATRSVSRRTNNIYADSHFCKITGQVIGELGSTHDYTLAFSLPGNYLPAQTIPDLVQPGTFNFFANPQAFAVGLNYKNYRVYGSKITARAWTGAEDVAPSSLVVWPAMESEEGVWNFQQSLIQDIDMRTLETIPYAKYKRCAPLINAATVNTLYARSAVVTNYMNTNKLTGDKSTSLSVFSAGSLPHLTGSAPMIAPGAPYRWNWYLNFGNAMNVEQWNEGGWNQTRFLDIKVVYYVKFFGRRPARPVLTISDI